MKKKTAKKPKLSILQQRFANNILKGMNKTDAYLSAGYKCSRSAARKNVVRMMANDGILAFIEKAQEKANIAAEITHEKILDEESRLAFYDPKELFDINGKQLPIHKLPENIRRALHGLEIITTALGGIKYKYKFHEKGKALERLEKIENMFAPERKELMFKGEVTIIDSYQVPDDEDPA